MNYPIHIETITMELSNIYFKRLLVNIQQNCALPSLKIVINLANSADPYEMQQKNATLWGISSESSMFAKVPIYQIIKG